MKMNFYQCQNCGQIIAIVEETGMPIICCGEPMKKIAAGTADASKEKHVPVCEIAGNKIHVTVGSDAHPMTDDHYIKWIAIQTKQGNQRKCLTPGMKPEACFAICDDDEVLAVYAYCNLHSLWKA